MIARPAPSTTHIIFKTFKIKIVHFIAVIALLTSITVFAEETKAPQPAPIWFGNSELSYLMTSGNTEISTLGAGTELNYEPKLWKAKFKASGVYGKSAEKTIANQTNVDLRVGRTIINRLEGFTAVGYLRNPFNSFNSRINIDAGLAYYVLESDDLKLKTDAGFGYATEERTTGLSQSYANTQIALRGTWQASATTKISNDLVFLQNLKDSKDWRWNNDFSVSSSISSLLSIKFGYKLGHLNLPAAGFKKLDTTTTVALVAKY